MEAPGSAGSREPGCCRPRAAAWVLPHALVFLHDTALIYSRRPRHAGASAKRSPFLERRPAHVLHQQRVPATTRAGNETTLPPAGRPPAIGLSAGLRWVAREV